MSLKECCKLVSCCSQSFAVSASSHHVTMSLTTLATTRSEKDALELMRQRIAIKKEEELLDQQARVIALREEYEGAKVVDRQLIRDSLSRDLRRAQQPEPLQAPHGKDNSSVSRYDSLQIPKRPVDFVATVSDDSADPIMRPPPQPRMAGFHQVLVDGHEDQPWDNCDEEPRPLWQRESFCYRFNVSGSSGDMPNDRKLQTSGTTGGTSSQRSPAPSHK